MWAGGGDFSDQVQEVSRSAESQADWHYTNKCMVGGSRIMRFWVFLALIPLFVVSACGETKCTLPEDPRARADELIHGCFTGTTYCAGGSGFSGIEDVWQIGEV